MSILWRYALQSYLRVLFLSMSTFICVLIVARFKEIARFTALSGDFGKTGLFVVYQIPMILPIAIPLSALIASFLFFQRFSLNLELTALRASGLNFKKILAPLLIASFLLSLFTFSIASEIAPLCRRETKMLLYSETSQNPLLLLQRQKLIKIKNAYLDMQVENDELIKNLTLILHNSETNRLNLLSAKQLNLFNDQLLGSDLALISYLQSDQGFDQLIIENEMQMQTDASRLSNTLKRHRPKPDINALSFKMLQCSHKKKQAKIEMLRRTSLCLAVFSFTFLGAAFGIEERRSFSRKNLFGMLFLTLTVLLSYLFGKSLKHSLHLAMFVLLFPHPFIWICSTIRLMRINQGRV